MIKHNSSVHVRSFLFIVHGRVHHILWITEQRQIHELLIQVVLFTQSDGVVIGLRSCVKVHRLADFVLPLVLPCHMIGCRSVASLIGYHTGLSNVQNNVKHDQFSTVQTKRLNLPFECFLGNSERALERDSPERGRSNAALPPCLIGSPDNVPTTYTNPCPITNQTTRA